MRHLILTALLLSAAAGCTSDPPDTGTCADADRDGICNDDDLCIGDDATGDTDSDGTCDDTDLCLGDDTLGDADLDGICDGVDDACVGMDSTGDTDGDGICDDMDECDGDDALGDVDNDGICDGDADLCVGGDESGDTDGDGVCDDSDQCIGDDALGDTDGDGSCDDTDLCTGNDVTGDSDSDGICDDIDNCPNGVDTDGDGICDDVDVCTGQDTTGDDDLDGVCNDLDQCLGNDSQPDVDGDGLCEDRDICFGDDATFDTDGDGVCGDLDQCEGDDAQPDTDGDGICEDIDQCSGDDAAGDTDNDGVCDNIDQCTGNDAQPDTDGDGICEDIDQCVGNDMFGDSDNDGSCDDTDACIGDDTSGNADGDAYCDDVDQCDGDDAMGDFDNDGLCDDVDPCLGTNNTDLDRDGICDGPTDLCDGDDTSGDRDGDGICDDVDLCYGLDRLGDDDGNNVCGGGTIYHVVSGISSRFHDGLTWSNAFRDPSLAAEAARPGDTVFVRSIPDGSSAYPPVQVDVQDDVQWIGGFQGTETHPDERPTDRATGLPIPTPHGDIRESDDTAHWTVFGGYVDAFEFRGYRDAAIEVLADSVLNNIVIADENSQGSVGSSDGLRFADVSGARLTHFRCQGRDVRYNSCLTMDGADARIIHARFVNVTNGGFSSPMVQVNGGTLRMDDVRTALVSARVFEVGPTAELTVADGDLSNVSVTVPAAILYANRATVSFIDTVMLNNTVSNAVDLEGGLMDVYQSELTLARTHIAGTEIVDAEYIQGGVLRINSGTSYPLFHMTDSSIHDTTFNFTGPVLGGAVYLEHINASIIGNTFGPVNSPFNDERVDGALLHMEHVQATLSNNAMWTSQDLPLTLEGQNNLGWGPLCAPAPVSSVVGSAPGFVSLTSRPFAPATGARLLLASNSPCIDAGNTGTANAFDIWWPGRVSQQGTTRDVAPVDLGAHYNP